MEIFNLEERMREEQKDKWLARLRMDPNNILQKILTHKAVERTEVGCPRRYEDFFWVGTGQGLTCGSWLLRECILFCVDFAD